MKFLTLFVLFLAVRVNADEISPFLGAYRTVDACNYSGSKSRLYISLSSGRNALLRSLYGEDATQMEIPLGSGTRKAPGSSRSDAIEKYATQIENGSLISVVQFYRAGQLTGSERTDLKFVGKRRLVLSSGSSYLSDQESCLFEKK